ncbi:hypothetical protein Peur_056340 [Populus x canadensis]
MDSSPLQGKGKAQPELKPSQPSQAHVCLLEKFEQLEVPPSLFGKAAAYLFESAQGATLPSDNDTFSSTEETLVDQNGSFHGSFISRMSQFNSLHRVDVTINVITAFWSRSRIRSKHPKIEPPSVNKGLVDPSTRTGSLLLIHSQKFFTLMFHRSSEIPRQDHTLNMLCLPLNG